VSGLIEALIKKLEKDALKTGRDHRLTTQALRYVPVLDESRTAPVFTSEVKLIEGSVVH
jgi:hypothetical protein